MKWLTVFALCILVGSCTPSQKSTGIKEKARIDFDLPDGPYTNEQLITDFGAGRYAQERNHASIVDKVYRIGFVKGKKVQQTGAAVQIPVKPRKQYSLQYRIQYPLDFEKGLHGKQFGFIIGVGYDGGRGESARTNGDGGSVRLQFDAQDSTVSNQLYVYYQGMQGKYGNNSGGQKFFFPKGTWTDIKLTLTMQSAYDKADGSIEVWCNGVKQIEVKNMQFVRKLEACYITKLSFESFPGGGGIFPSYDNYVYVDDVKWWPGR